MISLWDLLSLASLGGAIGGAFGACLHVTSPSVSVAALTIVGSLVGLASIALLRLVARRLLPQGIDSASPGRLRASYLLAAVWPIGSAIAGHSVVRIIFSVPTLRGQ